MNQLSKSHKIAVFGATGMVGSAIVRSLKKDGFLKLLTPNRKELDLLDSYAVEKWFNQFKPNIVILAAAKVGGIYANDHFPADFILENLKIQINVIESSWKNKVNKLLFLGSSCIYPKFAKQPIQEDELLSGYLEPTNEPYAVAKIAGLKLCESLRRQYQFNAICLMPTNLYGPGDNYHSLNSHVIPSLIKRFVDAKINKSDYLTCWGSGSPKREFLHVDDLADACIFALKKWDPNKIDSPKDINGNSLCFLNVGTGLDISIKELANMISKLVDFEGDINWDTSRPDGTPKKKLNINRICNLGWAPKINFDYGLKKTIESYIEENIKNF
mgnify:CR=1 FL=1